MQNSDDITKGTSCELSLGHIIYKTSITKAPALILNEYMIKSIIVMWRGVAMGDYYLRYCIIKHAMYF